MDCYDKQGAHVGANGSSVNISINDGFKLRVTHYLLIVLCLALSIYSAVKVQEVGDLKTEVRLWAYWSERVNVQLKSEGINTPPMPDEKVK